MIEHDAVLSIQSGRWRALVPASLGVERLAHMQLAAPKIRVFVIDPQPLIAAALQHFFAANDGFAVVGSAQLANDTDLRSLRPDVIVVCQEHGSTDFCDMVAACRAATPAAKICVVACHPHPELLPRVIEAGADGYATKDTPPAELIEAVLAVHSGSAYVDPRIGANRAGAHATGRNRPVNALSVRETEVLKLIADGYSNREISIALSLSEKTIKNHISRIFAKLHITARTQAVVHAIKAGIA